MFILETLRRNKSVIVGVTVCVAVWGVFAAAGYLALRGLSEAEQKPASETEIMLAGSELAPTIARAEDIIKPTTNITYEYVYSEDGAVESANELAPYFLINMTRKKFAEVFEEWEVVKFSTENVIVRKAIEGAKIQSYIVGEQDGYISVFYQSPVNGETLKEKTNVPLSGLSEDEQERLREGVLVSDEDELLRVLEDYSS
ncbi:MAG: BofC C-terminal domain-containing protein [Clostridiales bacterium]|jgi:hypothetical protein|nr:BofC C-terminal domain-containing protein [Clostridiales bacterium]